MSASVTLPSGWTEALIEELVGSSGIFSDGDWVESQDQDPNGDVRLIQLADVGDGAFLNKSRRFLTSQRAKALGCTFLERNDVLIARMPDPLGRACLFPGDTKKSVTAVDVCIVRTGVEEIDHRWLRDFINAPQFRTKISSLQSGSTRKRISRRNLASLTLPVPPQAEQRRIVAKVEELLSDLDAATAALQRARANLKGYRAAMLKAAVEGKLTDEWRKANPRAEPAEKLLERILAERRRRWEEVQLANYAANGRTPPKHWKEKYPEPAKPEATELLRLPKGWCWASTEQLVVASEYGTSVKCDYDAAHEPVLRIPNIAAGVLDLQDLKHSTVPLGLDDETCLRPGDLLVCRTNGSIGLVGKAAVVTAQFARPHGFASYLLRLRFSELSSLPHWAHVWLTSAYGRAFVESKAASSAGQHNVSLSVLHNMSIPLPPLLEMQEILAYVGIAQSRLESAERETFSGVLRVGAVRQSILKRAFEGELVPQDSNDEPAAILLERIRAERSSGDSTKRPRRRRGSAEPAQRSA